jgi:hypothetical protein
VCSTSFAQAGIRSVTQCNLVGSNPSPAVVVPVGTKFQACSHSDLTDCTQTVLGSRMKTSGVQRMGANVRRPSHALRVQFGGWLLLHTYVPRSEDMDYGSCRFHRFFLFPIWPSIAGKGGEGHGLSKGPGWPMGLEGCVVDVLVVGLSWCARAPALADWSMSWTIDPRQADDSRALSKGVSDAAGGRTAYCTSLVWREEALHEADPNATAVDIVLLAALCEITSRNDETEDKPSE